MPRNLLTSLASGTTVAASGRPPDPLKGSAPQGNHRNPVVKRLGERCSTARLLTSYRSGLRAKKSRPGKRGPPDAPDGRTPYRRVSCSRTGWHVFPVQQQATTLPSTSSLSKTSTTKNPHKLCSASADAWRGRWQLARRSEVKVPLGSVRRTLVQC
jgi:hypothetical protein